MTVDEVKKWLNRVKKIEELIKLDKKRLKELEELATVVPCIPISEKVQTSKKLSANFENKVFKMDEQRRKLNNRIVERHNIKMEIDEVINMLDNNEMILVLSYIYLDFLTYREIATIIASNKSSVQRTHKKGLVELSKILGQMGQDYLL